MKKLFLLLAISPLLVACGQSKQESTSTFTTSPKTIVVATAGDIPPFDFEKDGNLTGYDVEVLKAVDEKLDQYKIEFQKQLGKVSSLEWTLAVTKLLPTT